MKNNLVIHLLNKVNGEIEKYEAIAKITGENFNVFEVLRLSNKEVKTHSSFLAELLNPQGRHGQGSIFLNLFVKQLEIEFSTDNVSVDMEKYIGPIDLYYKCGGSIDIHISNSKEVIIIENKIYSGDQKNQLVRYDNYGKSLNKIIFLLYLTLDGKVASEKSSGNLKEGKGYRCISYKEDIINWLELCKKEAALLPIIRETIVQYINLIKSLTNQTINNKMREEIVNQILENDYIESAVRIAENIELLKIKIMKQFKDDLISKFGDKNIEIRSEKKDFGKKETAFLFSKEESNYDVQFYFNEDFETLICGISDKTDKWIVDSSGIESNVFNEWTSIKWKDVYKGNEKLLQNIKEKRDQLFQEIEKIK